MTAQVPVSHIVLAHYGKALKKSDRVETGSYEVFGSSGVVGAHDAVLVRHPTLIVGRKGSVGSLTYAPDGGWPIDTTFYLELKHPDKVDLRYLYWALSQAGLARWTITTSIPGLSRDDLYRTRVPLPPLAEQRRIAAILDKADAIRRKRREAIGLLDELLKSAFLDGGCVPIRTKTSKKRLPRGWQWVLLTEVARLESGHTPSRRVAEYWGGEVDWLSLKDIRGLDGPYVNETTDHPTPLGIANSSARLLPAGTVAFCRTASVGKAAILGKEMATSQDFVNWVCGTALIPEFLYMVLYFSGSTWEAEKQGSTHKTIYMPTVERFRIALPPIQQQQQLAGLLTKVEVIRLKESSALCAADHLFNSLSQRAFRGEV